MFAISHSLLGEQSLRHQPDVFNQVVKRKTRNILSLEGKIKPECHALGAKS